MDAFCQQSQNVTPFGGNCSLCHSSIPSLNADGQAWKATGASAPERDASIFCPPPQGPTCTDVDQDGYGNPGDASCPKGSAMDCDDNDPAVSPGATENCTDNIDNNCNGLTDAQDPNAVGCPTCTDADNDTYFAEGASCGTAQDCDDSDPAVNPGMAEDCATSVDDDCDGQVNEGCDPACPDADGDSYTDASCGGADCADSDPAINPEALEICGNGIDENCNGMSDDTCAACPDGGVLTIKKAKYDPKKDGRIKAKGRDSVGSMVAVYDADTGQLIASGIPVKKNGKWKVKIDGLGFIPANILVENDAGCSTTAPVLIKGKKEKKEEIEDEGEDDEHEDDEHDEKDD